MEQRMSWAVEGLVAGLIGYVTVAALFMVLDLVSGRGMFHTPGLLGSTLFYGGGSVAGSEAAPVIAYNGIHMLVSFVVGLGAAWLVFQTERNRPLWYVVFFIFLGGFIYSVVVVGVLAAELTRLLSWGAIVLANLLAGVTAGGYLWWRHAGWLERFKEDLAQDY